MRSGKQMEAARDGRAGGNPTIAGLTRLRLFCARLMWPMCLSKMRLGARGRPGAVGNSLFPSLAGATCATNCPSDARSGHALEWHLVFAKSFQDIPF